ncbi:hypothetical protein [Streptomyces shenzhenensis]|uniref:hypothetical protein n=1 Tax=Streptomyces shenzhenensis TaxID=943815 RepID=UPI001F2C0C9D|nr:hypothetical protein [Streptomyces shenzhenensis]
MPLRTNFEVETDHTCYATDLDVLVHNTCGGYFEIYDTPEDAARATFTGKMAAKYGFTKVTIEETVGSPGEYTAAKVVFRK